MKTRKADPAELLPGDHVMVRRGGVLYAHHGVYSGEGRVVHFTDAAGLLAKGKARIVETSLEVFLGEGTLRIVDHGVPIDRERAVERARQGLEAGGYHLIWNNCEHFATHCATGRRGSRQVLRAAAGASVSVLAAAAGLFLAGRKGGGRRS